MNYKTDRKFLVNSLKEEIIGEFNNKDNPYEYSDRLNVAMHNTIDDCVSHLSFENALKLISQYSSLDFNSLDKGLYDGVLEKEGFEKLVIILVYCLLEQDLWNNDELNKLQFINIINGIRLK